MKKSADKPQAKIVENDIVRSVYILENRRIHKVFRFFWVFVLIIFAYALGVIFGSSGGHYRFFMDSAEGIGTSLRIEPAMVFFASFDQNHAKWADTTERQKLNMIRAIESNITDMFVGIYDIKRTNEVISSQAQDAYNMAGLARGDSHSVKITLERILNECKTRK